MPNINSSRKFRSLMGRFVTGVTVIAVPHSEEPFQVMAMTASSVTSVSLCPQLLLFCLRNESRMLPHLQAANGFTINVLSSHQDGISRFYGGQAEQGVEGAWEFTTGDSPVLIGANASFICTTKSIQVFGDHHIVVGEVVDMKAADTPAPALIYAAGKYHGVDLHHPSTATH